MSKAIGSVLGTNVKADTSAAQNYYNYLNDIDTSAADQATKSMADEALRLSENLSDLPDYQFHLDTSDAAAQRAENAVFQSYVDKLQPLHEKQTADLETKLANQGLSVGSQAYQRAMNDLTEQQNAALNQAAYNSVTAGQEAYNDYLKNQLLGANYTNTARQDYLNNIYALLQNSPTNYEKQLNMYAVQNGMAQQRANARQQSFNNTMDAVSGLLQTGGFLAGL